MLIFRENHKRSASKLSKTILKVAHGLDWHEPKHGMLSHGDRVLLGLPLNPVRGSLETVDERSPRIGRQPKNLMLPLRDWEGKGLRAGCP